MLDYLNEAGGYTDYYSNWANNGPDNTSGNENFAVISAPGGQWNNVKDVPDGTSPSALCWRKLEPARTCQEANSNVVNCWAPVASFAYNNDTQRFEQTFSEGECGFQYQDRDQTRLVLDSKLDTVRKLC